MSISVRFYLFAEDGLQRLSHRLVEGLIHGNDAMPQYAGTRQKTADVVIELEDGKPTRITRSDGHFLTFDENGQVHRALQAGGMAAMETFANLERSNRVAPSKVVDLSPKLNRDKWERENRWKLSKQDLDRIADDIWKRKLATSPKIQQAKGANLKPPAMTYEATEAVKEIQTHLFGIENKLEYLSEPALKGLAFEARRLSAEGKGDPVWRGIADAVDRRREILARYKSGLGVWYASVEITRWDRTSHVGQTNTLVHEKCNSKREAEEVARRLLAENAQYFGADNSVEAQIACDLEWEGD